MGEERLLLVYLGHVENKPEVVKVKIEGLDGYHQEYTYMGPLTNLAGGLRGTVLNLRKNRNLITLMGYHEVGVVPLSEERLDEIGKIIRK